MDCRLGNINGTMGGRKGGFDWGVKRYYETGVVSSKTLSSFDWPIARPDNSTARFGDTFTNYYSNFY